MDTRAQANSVTEAEESVKAGSLMILTPGTLMNSYQKRWFVIIESQLNHELVFHTSESKADKKGRLNLDEVTEIRSEPTKVSKSFSKGPDEELRFELVCEGKIFEMAAMNRSEKADWLAVLARVCDLPIQGAEDESARFFHQGALLKQSGGGKRGKVWALRLFTLRTEGAKPALSYYSGPKEASLKGTILLEDITELRAWSKNDGTETPALSLRFEIVSHARTYVLSATETGASSDKEEWMEKIASSCSLEISRSPPAAETAEAPSADTKFSGWLSKQGGGASGLKNWKSRFFVLTSEKLLYYTDATLAELKGEILVSSMQSIVPFSQVRRECGIELVTPERTYVLAADSADVKVDWVKALGEVAGVAPETVKFPDSVKGWLWKKAAKGAAFQRHLFVLVEEQVKEKRFSIVNFSEVLPPPTPPADGGSGDNESESALSLPPVALPPPTAAAARKGKTKLRLLAFSDEGCTVQTAGLASNDIEAVVLQEYGSVASSASPYLNWRLEVVSASLGTWVLASDSDADRRRWLDEFKKAGIGLVDKRPSQQQWDYEGLLQTRKQNASLGWKERYVRLAGTRFVVFREQSSQVVKETIDVTTLFLETIKVKESGGTFRFRLYLGPEEDGVFMDWATTTEKLRGEWIKSLLSSGCKVASSDSQVVEAQRCDVLEKRSLDVQLGACLSDFQGDVCILKSSRNVLASSYKKRFARLRGCRFSWAHLEDSQDIDGLLCIDNLKCRVHVYECGPDKLWPFVLRQPAAVEEGEEQKGRGEEVTFVVASQEVRDAWVSALATVLEHGQAVGLKYVNALISTSLAPAKERLEAAEKEGGGGEASDLKAEVSRLEADIKREQGSPLEELVSFHAAPLEHEKPPDVRVTKKDAKKKKTFGKRGGGKPAPKRKTAFVQAAKGEEEDGALKSDSGPGGLAPPLSAESLPSAPGAENKEAVAGARAVAKPIVLPPQDERAEAKPSPVYPKNVVMTTESAAASPPTPSSEDTAVELATPEKDAPVLQNFATGDGFVFHGRWAYDWLNLLPIDATGLASPVALAPPPECLAYRVDMGAKGELLRCY